MIYSRICKILTFFDFVRDCETVTSQIYKISMFVTYPCIRCLARAVQILHELSVIENYCECLQAEDN